MAFEKFATRSNAGIKGIDLLGQRLLEMNEIKIGNFAKSLPSYDAEVKDFEFQ